MTWYLGLCLILGLALYGAAARRYMGGWKPVPYERGVSVAAVVLPLGFAAAVAWWGLGPWWWLAAGAGAMLSAGLATCLGDGDATDYGEWDLPEPDRPSWDWLAGASDNAAPLAIRRLRDIRALAVSGLAVTLIPGAVMVGAGHLWAGVAVGLSGALKVAAYALGYAVPVQLKDLRQGREAGEALWGACIGAAAAGGVLAAL